MPKVLTPRKKQARMHEFSDKFGSVTDFFVSVEGGAEGSVFRRDLFDPPGVWAPHQVFATPAARSPK